MANIPNLGIVVGLVAEARISRKLGRTEIGGGLPRGAHAAAERAVAAGATALLSFGLAGGLDSRLAPGTIAIPARILHQGRIYDADPTLLAWLGGTTIETLVATEAPAATKAAKLALHRHTGASAVDLETGEVAATAARHNIPFAALRVICDPATRDLPPAALVALNRNGGIAALRIAASVLRHPGQLAALLRLAADARAAHATLRHLAARLA